MLAHHSTSHFHNPTVRKVGLGNILTDNITICLLLNWFSQLAHETPNITKQQPSNHHIGIIFTALTRMEGSINASRLSTLLIMVYPFPVCAVHFTLSIESDSRRVICGRLSNVLSYAPPYAIAYVVASQNDSLGEYLALWVTFKLHTPLHVCYRKVCRAFNVSLKHVMVQMVQCYEGQFMFIIHWSSHLRTTKTDNVRDASDVYWIVHYNADMFLSSILY